MLVNEGEARSEADLQYAEYEASLWFRGQVWLYPTSMKSKGTE